MHFSLATLRLDRLFPASIYVVGARGSARQLKPRTLCPMIQTLAQGGAGSVSNRPLRTLECFSSCLRSF